MNKWVILVSRILLGIPLLVFGANGFLQFMPMSTEGWSASGVAFINALMATGYVMPFMSLVFILTGIAFLANRFVPLALLLLAPFMVNILLWHLFLSFGGIWMGLVMTVLMIILVIHHWDAYRGFFKPS